MFSLIIVTPTQQTQSWYPELLRLSVRDQIILPLQDDLLKGPQNQHHPFIQNRTMQLAVWVDSRSVWQRKELFNNRPLQPKYNFIRDVQLVLFYLKKELPNNNDWSDKLLTFKVTILLALTSVSRVRVLHILDTRFMVKTSQKYVFKFHKLHKSWSKSQQLQSLQHFLKTKIFVLCHLWMNILLEQKNAGE